MVVCGYFCVICDCLFTFVKYYVVTFVIYRFLFYYSSFDDTGMLFSHISYCMFSFDIKQHCRLGCFWKFRNPMRNTTVVRKSNSQRDIEFQTKEGSCGRSSWDIFIFLPPLTPYPNSLHHERIKLHSVVVVLKCIHDGRLVWKSQVAAISLVLQVVAAVDHPVKLVVGWHRVQFHDTR